MRTLYCQYCGQPQEDECDCEMLAAAEAAQWLEDYNNDPEVHAGWVNEDRIEFGHCRQR